MSRMDWDVMVADLEEKRTAAAQELADIDAVIAAVRQRANGDAPPAPKKAKRAKKLKSAPSPQHAKGNGTGQDKITPDQLATMRTQFEAGVKVGEICKRVGVSDATVYNRAKAGHWKRPGKAKATRPNLGVAASPAAAAPAQQTAGTQLSGSVKCTNPECGAWTSHDPCSKCGVKLKRKGW